MKKLRNVLLFLLATFLLIATLLTGGYFFIGSATGNATLARIVNKHARWQNGQVQVAGLFLNPAKQLQCESIRIADANGTWLRLRHIDMKWRVQFFPLRVTLSSAHVAQIHLARLPQAAQHKSSVKPFSLSLPRFPSLPFEFACSDIRIKKILLDKKLVGKELVYQFLGQLRLARNLATIQTELTGHSAHTGNATLRLHLDSRSELSLRARVTEPAGGILAKAINMPGGMQVSANGDGKLHDWHGAIHLSAPDWGEMKNRLFLAVNEEKTAIHLDSQTIFGPRLVELKNWLGQSPELHLQTTVYKDKIICEQLQLTSRAGKIRGTGTLERHQAQVNLLADIRDISRLKQKLFMDIAPAEPVRLNISGPYSKMDVTASAGAKHFTVPGFSAHDIRVDFSGTLVSTQKKMLRGELRLASSKLAPHRLRFHNIRLKSHLQSSFTDLVLSHITITGKELALKCQQPVIVDKRGICDAGRLVIKRYDAASLAPYLGQGWTGTITGYVDARGCNANQQFDLLLKSTDLFSPYLELKKLANQKIVLRGSGALTTKNIQWKKARLLTPDGYVFCSGEVNWSIKHMDIRAESKILSLSLFHNAVQGQAHTKGRIWGNLFGPNLRLIANSPLIDCAGKSVQDFVLRTEFEPQTQKGKFDASLLFQNEPVHLNTVFKQKKQSIRLLQGSLSGLDTQANIFGQLFYKTNHGNIGLHLGSLNLQRVGKLLALPLYGNIKGEANWRWQQETIAGQFQLEGNKTGLTATGKGKIAIQGKLGGTFAHPRLRSNGEIYNFAFSDTNILRKAVFAVQGTKEAVKASFKAVGRAKFPFSVASRIEMEQKTGATHITLADLNGKIGPEILRLNAPVKLVFSQNNTLLAPAKLQFGQGSIAVSGQIQNKNITCTGQLKNISTWLPSVFLPIQEYGDMSLQANISGPCASPVIKTAFQVHHLIPAAATSSRQDFSLSGHAGYAHNQASFSSSFTNNQNNILTIKADAPVQIDLSRSGFALTGKARMKIKGRMEMNWIPYMFGLEDHLVNAASYFDVQAEYFDNDFSWQGYARVKGGKYEFLPTGTVLRNLDLAVNLKNRDVIVDFGARDAKQGTVKVNATLHLNRLVSFGASIQSSDFLALENDLVTTNINTKLTLSGNTQKCHLNGDIRINSAQLRLSETNMSSVTTLEVQEIDSTGNLIEHPQKIRRTSPLDLNVNITVPDRFFITGRGLESEWKGSVLVGGNAASPSLTGGFEIMRGTYLFAGREFLFSSEEHNKIQFVGDFPPNPSLKIAATSRVDDLLVKLQVQGVLTDFSLSLLSEPMLPEDEILARVLFGRSLDSISPVQALHLAQTLAHLTGAGKNHFDVVNGVRKMLGVDTLKIGNPEDSGDGVSVGVGKYLTEKVYVEYEKSPIAGEDSFSVETEITPHLSLDAKIGGTENGKAGLQWKHDY